MSSWAIHTPKRVVKNLQKFPQADKKRIIEILRECAVNPWEGDIVKIQGEENLWRRRVGSYRILFSPNTAMKVVEIKEIERRTSKMY